VGEGLESISMTSSVEFVGRLGDGLSESSTADRSGAVSSCGSTTIVLSDDISHRSSMRPNLKKSRPLRK
jgi:hypothetical protein